MEGTADLTRPVIDSLYGEALLLADEARATFDLSGRPGGNSEDEDLARIALSCEALRTTTRMMHVIAWLLNQKAYFNGEISEFQLRRQGRLTSPGQPSDPDQLAYLDQPTRDLIERTHNFYSRIERLDKSWGASMAKQSDAVLQMQERLNQAVNRF